MREEDKEEKGENRKRKRGKKEDTIFLYKKKSVILPSIELPQEVCHVRSI